MIFDGKRFHLKIFNNSDEIRHLERTAEMECFDQFVSRLKAKNFKENKLYNYDYSVYHHFGRIKTDRNKYHSDVSRVLSRKITDHNPHLVRDKLAEKIKRKVGVDISGVDESALWLTSYAYEFFFITQPKKELDYYNKSMNTRILTMEDSKRSYLNLRKMFINLYAPAALGQGIYDNNVEVSLKIKGRNVSKDFIREYLRICQSEGFMEYIPNFLDYIDEIDPTIMKNIYDQYPVLSTFFVQLFSDDAKRILKKGKYKLNKLEVSSSERREGYRSIRDFYLEEFMPLVYKKITKLINTEPSSAGWEIYTSVCELRDAQTNNQKELERILGEKIKQYFDPKYVDWDSWCQKIEKKSAVFNEWINNKDKEEYFDQIDNNKTVEELLNNTFDDKRSTRKRDKFKYY